MYSGYWGRTRGGIVGAAVVGAIALLIAWRVSHLIRERSPLFILHQSITAGADVPMRAELTMTRRRHGRTYLTLAHVIQGPSGAYRMEYLLPKATQGRIVTSDGHTNWQYEPRQQILARITLAPGNDRDEIQAEELIGRNYRVALVSDEEAVAGRRAYLLELLPRHQGKSTQRRWIDRATFKTLRIETHYPDGILARMVAYDSLTLPARVSPSEFVPSPAKTARRIDGPAPSPGVPVAAMGACARSLGLSAEGPFGFRLSEVTSGDVRQTKAAHLLYTDGIETVSIFVQKGGRTTGAMSPSWRAALIHGLPAFENLDGHLDTVVWTNGGRRYTAVSHLGPTQLKTFVAGQIGELSSGLVH